MSASRDSPRISAVDDRNKRNKHFYYYISLHLSVYCLQKRQFLFIILNYLLLERE